MRRNLEKGGLDRGLFVPSNNIVEIRGGPSLGGCFPIFNGSTFVHLWPHRGDLRAGLLYSTRYDFGGTKNQIEKGLARTGIGLSTLTGANRR